MSISIDVYTPVIGTDFLSQAFATLEGYDLFFHVSTTNQLRLKQMSSSSVQILKVGVTHVCVIPQEGVVHVYYLDMGGVLHYFPFTSANFIYPIHSVITGLGTGVFMSAMYSPNSTPPVYAMIVDTGVYHMISTSLNPAFSSIEAQSQVYNNALDADVYVGSPVVGMHPDDTKFVTVVCQHTVISTGNTKVGLYTAQLPGVI